MPISPPTLRPRGQSRVANVQYDARRRKVSWRKLYKMARWDDIRRAQLAVEPLCRMCLHDEPSRVTPATVCDHIRPHRGDEALFFAGPFQSLCASCHSARKQRQEQQDLMRRGCWD